MSLIENLNWRYATKKFDNTKKVNDQDLETIKKALQLSASSYGLQLYKILIIEDIELREKLKPGSWGQSQITDASHLIVFCNYADVANEHIDEYTQLKAETMNINHDNLKGYGDFIKEKMGELDQPTKQNWTARQTYIALGNLLVACADLRIDACPMEGFDPSQYEEILGLESRGLKAAVIATIGYRSDEDQTQHAPKVRKSFDDLFETI
ncbi:MAG: NAD(P)H-dependent oxidoreductase [Bacteroidota bacterium]